MQVEFALKFLSGEKELPSTDEMMQDLHANLQKHREKGYPKWKTHYLINVEDEYLKQLADVGDLKPIPEVYLKMVQHTLGNILTQPTEFRKYKYTVIDEHNFDCVKFEN